MIQVTRGWWTFLQIREEDPASKLKTLSQHISSIFQKNIAQKDVDRIIDMLFANKMISETNNTISYDFWHAQPSGQPDAGPRNRFGERPIGAGYLTR